MKDWQAALRCSTAYSCLSLIRILHATPDVPPVDVYANGNLIAQGLACKEFTDYLPVKTGRYRIRVFRAGEDLEPLIDTAVRIPARFIGTLAVTGALPGTGVLTISEQSARLAGKAAVRFAHLSPDAPNLDLRLSDGAVFFDDVGYGEITEYAPLGQGSYDCDLCTTGAGRLSIRIPGLILEPGKVYTIYAVGPSAGRKPQLETLLSLDGTSYMSF